MKLAACQACKHAVQIVGTPEEVMNLLGAAVSYPCITPLCRGRMLVTAPTIGLKDYVIEEVPLQGFFRAIHGFGPGNGAPASLKRLKELLLSQRVVDIVAEPVGQPERVILRELVLEGGARLHFERSARGACVYYIEEPGDVSTTDAASECDNPNREEAGRDTQAGPGGCQDKEGPVGEPRASELPDSGSVPSVPEAGEVLPGGVQGCT